MRISSLAVLLSAAVSASAYWDISYYTDANCKTLTGEESLDKPVSCQNFDSSVAIKSVDVASNGYTLTAYVGKDCKGEGYSLQDGKCAKGGSKNYPEFRSFEVQKL
ncbi:hypothetical protein PENSOL_c042G04719 [Penicillium solitum]|uniref:Uncharacterized protein n=1 Tax=Penicillium solitum TaxID=60172 RepID=A0A1V6QSW4_9EURO|nr:uncharacterized protein PENSOL_c042G04719 [Penicillium solitum]OQD92299.1 hypothetical protein PENSOL_c042G04719 [Penicillium solitum]